MFFFFSWNPWQPAADPWGSQTPVWEPVIYNIVQTQLNTVFRADKTPLKSFHNIMCMECQCTMAVSGAIIVLG